MRKTRAAAPRAAQCGRDHAGHAEPLRSATRRRTASALLLGVCTGALLCSPAPAATDKWTGAASQDWTAGTNWDQNAAPGVNDTVEIDSQGSQSPILDGIATSTDRVDVGVTAAGSLTLRNGAKLDSGFNMSSVGAYALAGGGTSTALLDGAGTRWTTTQLLVGKTASGLVTVQNGAYLKIGSEIDLGYNGGSGTLSVTGVNSRLTAPSLVAGLNDAAKPGGTGSVSISSGATATLTGLVLGYSAQSSGSATVDGAGTQLSATVVQAGYNGTGSIVVSNGASLTSQSGTIGFGASATGTALVTGATWNNGTGSFQIGGTGSVLTVQNGGSLQTGSLNTMQGQIVATGAGTAVQVSGQTYIAGSSGAGDKVLVQNGASFTTHDFTLGDNVGLASFTVDGAGSTLNVSGQAVVAYTTHASLVLTNGGTATFTDPAGLEIGHNGLTGQLWIGQGNNAPGTLVASGVHFGPGNGQINFDHVSTSYVFSAPITGVHGAIVAMGGTTSLTGDSSAFAGSTLISGGTLLVDNKLGGDATADGGTLGGAGAILGNVVVTGNGTLSGIHGQTLSIGGALTMQAGATLDVSLDAPDNGATPLFSVGGNLTLDGTLNVAARAGFGAGLYRIFSYGGGLTDHGLSLAGVPAGTSGADFMLQESIAGQVNLVYTPAGGAPPPPPPPPPPSPPPPVANFWNGGGSANGVIQGGNGIWSASSATFADAQATVMGSLSSQAGIGIFAGNPGMVTIDGSLGQVTAPALQFAADGYRLQGDALLLTGGTVRVGDGSAAGADFHATISAPLIGGNGLIKTDLGTLVLDGDNHFDGGTQIVSGTLQIGSGGTSGSIPGDVANEGLLAFDRSDALTFGGTVSGSGALRQLGSGTLSLSAPQAYTGATTISAGTLALVGAGAITSSSGVIDNAVFDISGLASGTSVRSLTGAGRVLLGTNVLTLTQQSGTFDGTIEGTGGLRLGQGILVVRGANSFTGGTTIDNGATLRLGGSGTSGSVAGPIVDNGTLVFDRSDTVAFAGDISGGGAVQQAGTGTTILTGHAAHSGGTFITAGTLRGDSNSLQGAIVNAGTLVFDQAAAGLFSGDISGTGALVKTGAGLLNILGPQDYSGSTLLQAGNLVLVGGLPNSDVSVTGGVLDGYGPVKSLTVIGGVVSPGQSIGMLSVGGDATLGVGSTYAVEIDASGASDQIRAGGKVTLQGGALTLTGPFAHIGTSYELISATGGITGQFGSVSYQGLPFVKANVLYQGEAVSVQILLNGDALAAAAQTRNQMAAAHALADVNGPSVMLDAVAKLTTAAAPAALDTVSGEVHATARTAMVDDDRAVRDAILDHAAIGSSGDTPPRLWGQMLAGHRRFGGSANEAAAAGNLFGLLTGVDLLAGPEWRLGLLAGYEKAPLRLDDRRGDAHLKGWHVGAYAGGRIGSGVALHAGLSYTGWSAGVQRSIAFPGYTASVHGRDHAHAWQGFGELTWRGSLGKLTIEPFLTADAIRLSSSIVRESGDAAAVHGRAADMAAYFGQVGLRLASSQAWGSGVIRPHASLALEHGFGDDAGTFDLAFAGGTTSAYRVTGARLATDRAVLRLGADMTQGRLSLGLGVVGQYGRGQSSTGGQARLAWRF